VNFITLDAENANTSYQVCDPDAIACAIARHKKLMAKAAPLMERRAAEARARMADYALQKAAEASMNGFVFHSANNHIN
jgi:hypothetical protein